MKSQELKYRIIRHYQDRREIRVLRVKVTKEHAKEHCKNPESSSNTCSKPYNLKLKQRVGRYFDTYTSL